MTTPPAAADIPDVLRAAVHLLRDKQAADSARYAAAATEIDRVAAMMVALQLILDAPQAAIENVEIKAAVNGLADALRAVDVGPVEAATERLAYHVGFWRLFQDGADPSDLVPPATP